MTRFALAVVAIFAAAPEAQAQCAAQVIDTLTCSSNVAGRLRPGAWGASTPVPSQGSLTPHCPDGFNTLNSDVGGTCSYLDDQLFGTGCLNAGIACSGDIYTCGGPNVDLTQNGPDDVYEFTCQQDGDVTVSLSGMDCDLDLYVLDSTCDPMSGCEAGSTARSRTPTTSCSTASLGTPTTS